MEVSGKSVPVSPHPLKSRVAFGGVGEFFVILPGVGNRRAIDRYRARHGFLQVAMSYLISNTSDRMPTPQHIRIAEYQYPLPEERIAKYPLAERDSSKLLVYRRGQVTERIFRDLPTLLPSGELVVFNNTKVIYARLHFRKATGALIEVFCLEPHTPADYQLSFSQRGGCSWTCLVGNLKKWKEGVLERTIFVNGRALTLRAERLGMSDTGHEVRFTWDADDVTFAEVLDAIGELPIPPYLNRATEEQDLQTYQTVYSKVKGSVAAPTAGLHFTPEVLRQLDESGIERNEITLHVGAGTFKPVKSEEIGGHTMHAEWVAVKRSSLERLLAHGCHCTAVGTTSVRTLESLYYIGVQVLRRPDLSPDELHVPQWMPYELAAEPGVKPRTAEALQALLDYMDAHALPVLHASTRIIIAPGYNFHIVRRIITNFHQPGSTLLLLVSAFVRGDWHRIYDYALDHGFRFLSYGDSSLLESPDEMLPLVDDEGLAVGTASRGECHGGTFWLHPVVHLHVFNAAGELYLQKRPDWKDIQPGKWDTAVGGHADCGETPEEALRRETREEIGLTDFRPEFLERYVFSSARERELVHVFRTMTDQQPVPSEEVADGRFFSADEIRSRLGTGFFTPNFEQEWQRIFGTTAANSDAVAANSGAASANSDTAAANTGAATANFDTTARS